MKEAQGWGWGSLPRPRPWEDQVGSPARSTWVPGGAAWRGTPLQKGPCLRDPVMGSRAPSTPTPFTTHACLLTPCRGGCRSPRGGLLQDFCSAPAGLLPCARRVRPPRASLNRSEPRAVSSAAALAPWDESSQALPARPASPPALHG